MISSPGPLPKVRGALPKVKAGFWAKAEVSNHSAVFWRLGREPGRSEGLPTKFGRTPSE